MYVQAITDFDFMKKKYPQEVHIVDLSDEVLDLTCKAYQSYTEDPNNINPKAILKNYEIFTKEIITKQTISFDKYPEQNPCRLFKNDGEKAMFEMESGVKIFIYRDDLVMLRGIGTLVSAENSAFTGNGALAKSILQRAGLFYKKHHDQVQLDSRKKRVSKGSTIAMDAGKLDYRFVIHAVVSRFSEDADRKKDELVDLKITTLNVLRHADLLCTSEKKSKNLEKIAMPLLGAGMYIHCIFFSHFSAYLSLILFNFYVTIASYTNHIIFIIVLFLCSIRDCSNSLTLFRCDKKPSHFRIVVFLCISRNSRILQISQWVKRSSSG